MRFTTITGKAKKYVETYFDIYSICFLENLQPQCIMVSDENKLYGTFKNQLYHFPTIREELKAYLRRYVRVRQDVIDSKLATWTWEDVFNSKTTKELLNPPSIPIIKIEPTSPVNQLTQPI